MGKPRRLHREHAALLERLASVQQQQASLRRSVTQFLNDPTAGEKREALVAVQTLQQLVPQVHVLGTQTNAVVERIANANEVAEKMTREVRQLDIVQSRLTATLAQSSELLQLRNALIGARRALQLRQYSDAATFLKQLKDIANVLPLDVADRLRVEAIEEELSAHMRHGFDDGLETHDRLKVRLFAPLFQIIGEEQEEQGLQQLLEHVRATLAAIVTAATTESASKTWSTQEFMTQLSETFNTVAAVVQEFDALADECFPHVSGANRLITEVYGIGAKAAVSILEAFMHQRNFRRRMSAERDRADTRPMSPSRRSASASNMPSSPTAKRNALESEDSVSSVESEHLNEMALMIQHTQTFERFVRSRVRPATTHASNTPLPVSALYTARAPEIKPVLPPIHESELGKSVQELAGFYCFFENELLSNAAAKALQWEELHFSTGAATTTLDQPPACFPISSAIDEVFYVVRNSGLRALATGHADCSAGVLNMVTTVLRDSLAETMRTRIREMEIGLNLKGDSESSLAAASHQLRDQMQQHIARLSKTMPLQIPAATVMNAAGSTTTAEPIRRELDPDVILNSLEAAVDYVTQLKDEFSRELTQDFPDAPSHLQLVLGALDGASGELSHLLQAARDRLGKLLEPRIAGFLGPLLTTGTKRLVQYELTEEKFTFNEANDPFAQPFVASMRLLLAELQSTLSPTNFVAFVQIVAKTTVDLIERWFVDKKARFNQLGALQFDKDMRVLAAFFSEFGDGRASFARLTQLALILAVDAPNDVLDFIGRPSRGVAWQLTAAHVKDALSRRIEFSAAAIESVVLSR